MVEHDSFTIGA